MTALMGMTKPNADKIREEKGKTIADTKDAIKCLSDNRYKLRSQSGNSIYNVEMTEIGWKCTCPDHKFRGMKCKHIWAVEISQGMRKQAKPKIILVSVNPQMSDKDVITLSLHHLL